MFLYEKKDNSLDVYSFIGNEQAMTEYRRSKMLEIPEKDRILVAESYCDDMSEPPLLEFYVKKFDTSIIPMESLNYQVNELRYHFLKVAKANKINNNKLLDSYYCGNLSDKSVARVQDLDKLRYFLLPNNIYSADRYDNRYKRLENIIELPESLFLLQMLEQEKFSLLKDKDISDQLSLFSVSCIDELCLDELKKMDNCGITQNAYKQTLIKAENDKNILKLIRK